MRKSIKTGKRRPRSDFSVKPYIRLRGHLGHSTEETEKMSFVVKKAIQDFAKKKNLQVSGEFYGALDKKIGEILGAAAVRTNENKRKTLKPYDL
jgi:hypothetical protein